MPRSSDNFNRLTLHQTLVVYYIPFLLLGDLLSVAFSSGGDLVAIVRGALSIIYLLPLLWTTSLDRSLYRSVWLFILYVSILFFFASRPIYSINVSSKVFLSLLCVIIGHWYTKNEYTMDRLNRMILLSSLMALVNIIVARYFGFGGRTYSIDLELGNVSGLNVYTYLILLAPLFYLSATSKFQRLVFNLALISMLVYLMVSFKRITIAGVFVGYAVFFILYRKQLLAVKYLLIICMVLFILSPLYWGIMEMQFESRSSNFSDGALQAEARYKETPLVWMEVLSFSDPLKSIFGGEAFNTVGMYGGGLFDGRMAHVDYNGIVISNGLLGFWLYLAIFIQLFKARKRFTLNLHDNKVRTINAVFWAVFITSFFTSLSGGVMEITFRSIMMLYLGAMLRYLENHAYTPTDKKHVSYTADKANKL